MVAILPPLHPDRERALFELYAEVSGKPIGQGVGVLRDVIVAPTRMREADALWRSSSTFVASAWFEPFGFYGARRSKGGPPVEDFFGSAGAGRLAHTVVRQLEALQRHSVEWIFAWEYISLIPNETLKKSIELFATKMLTARERAMIERSPSGGRDTRHADPVRRGSVWAA